MLIVTLITVNLLPGQIRLLDRDSQTTPKRQVKTVPPYQVPVKGTALERTIVPSDYLVGPGDRFIISILSSEPYLEIMTITPTGDIVIPEIGVLSVAGLSAEEARQRILVYLKEIFPSYKATCVLYGIRGIRVSVTGAVKRPGFREVTQLSRLTDLLDVAGGVQPNAVLHRIRLIRDSEEERVLDLTSYYHEGDLSQNLYLKAGDQVIVPYGEITSDLVLVRGLGTGVTYQAIKPGETLASLMKRIAHGKNADRGDVTLQRQQGADQPEQRVVPADQFSSTTLQPGDVLYINTIAEIAVVGEVRAAGRFAFQPGLTADDYVVLAGGITRDGSSRKVEITRGDGRTARGGDTQVQAGDTIYVPRSFNSVFLGQLGMIQAALTFLNIYLAYLAAVRTG
ncbi:MAG: SLBB domain-containing protein [Fidelibacterota bacterium]|nr:MAG: SLBB domain-containing protein [Candidatus Neomarinimicrobiota bacterium]